MTHVTRRELLRAGAATILGASLPNQFFPVPCEAAASDGKLPVAAIVTEYRTNSHADVIVGKILEGYSQDGGKGPGLTIASMYVDQFPESDLSRKLAEKHGFPIFKSIDQAISLGGDRVQVAGVLSIGEHGQYGATPDTHQHMYPRRRFFDEIVAAFRRCGKVVPVFNDKHLSYKWDDAKFMVDTAHAMNFPLLAGSSVPLAWRVPVLELPLDCEIEHALSIGHGGLEAYGFHALEAHESMIERRKHGETGVSTVQAVTGEAIRESQMQGRWSKQLFEAALKTLPGSLHDNDEWIKNKTAAAYLLEHKDGLKSAVIMANGLAEDFAFAAKLKGRDEPVATWFKLQPRKPYGHFAYLVQAIEHTIRTGKTAYPVERTLLTTGILDRVMHSLAADGKQYETPELAIAYPAANWIFANHADSKLTLPND